jgi:hypothetical protein
VLAVIFMPPTMIASIYDEFQAMPSSLDGVIRQAPLMVLSRSGFYRSSGGRRL